jgi:ribosome-associated protein
MTARLRVSASCSIPMGELEWRFDRSGGPGGQHANTSSTRVEVRFDIARSQALGPRQRQRLEERLGPVVTATAADTRSQARNRELALDRLRGKLAEGLRVERRRHPGRPSRVAKERRLEAKRRRSAIKRERRDRFDPE